jgi:hypothetical protein
MEALQIHSPGAAYFDFSGDPDWDVSERAHGDIYPLL